jgi:predicted HicB family RNase H-like nuclease
MNKKLTLRMDTELVRTAKIEAGRRGKSVSQIVGEQDGACQRTFIGVV